MLELPITTTRVLSRNLPAGGGGYFRLLPYRASRWAIERVNRVDRQPAIFYFHPWEIDPQQPRIASVSVKTRFRHYLNLDRTESRLHRLLSDFRWDRIDRVFEIDAREAPRFSCRSALVARGANVSRRRPPGMGGFVARPDATFFHRIEWREILQEVFRHRTHYLVAERGGKLCGVLPLARIRSLLFGDALVSLPFAVYGGAAASDAASRSALHRVAVDLARDLGVRHLELRDRVQCEPDWPQQELYVTFRKTLLPEAEANLLAIPRKQRAMVRGIERGLVGEIDRGVERFFELYADNQHRHGTRRWRRYFEALREAFGDDCEVLTVVDRSGVAVSSVLSFYHRDEICRTTPVTMRRRVPSLPRLQVLGPDAAGCRARPAYLRLRAVQAGDRLVRLQEELGIRTSAAALRICAAAR